MRQNAGWQNWSLCLLASLGLHAFILGGFLLFGPERPKPKRVVAVEAVCLVPKAGPLGGKSGGGGPELSPSPPKPAQKPAPPPKIKPKAPQRKPARKVAPLPPEPTPIPDKLAMARPAPAPRPRPVAAAALAATGPQLGRAAAARGAGNGLGSGRGPGKGAGSGSGLGSGQGQGSGSGNILAGYLATVRQLLEKHKRYPGEARRRWQEGVVVLSFTITRNGEIAQPRVSHSSGHQILDNAARETLKRLSRFPPFPAQLHRSQLAIQVPLAFRLRDG
ncbi:MAG: energy transducer TonB [Syntrophales bacterium]|nr:energy transducer TonB [Syntrophales bacterium]MDD5641939.1 energy transducer TonB [Syntrophales bacterium]